MIKVGITGGIGSGKSTLCRLLAERGVAIYDSDQQAKRLMHEDHTLRQALIAAFGEEVYREGAINRPWLAERVFRNSEQLARLNSLVHPAVMRDFHTWAEQQSGEYVVLESAILFSANLAGEVDYTVAVLAPEALRLERTCRRDGADREAVQRRMAAQMRDEELAERADYTLVNVIEEELAASAEHLDKILRYATRKA